MSRPVACVLGFHAWLLNAEDKDLVVIQCLRCGKRESPAPNVALRFGFDNYMMSN
jgi:hypothetical protein